MIRLDPLAIKALRENQRQLDQDGDEVGVSRQALEETLAYFSGVNEVLEKAARSLEMTPQEIRLMAGKMTTQEMRTVKAVLNSRAAHIRGMKTTD